MEDRLSFISLDVAAVAVLVALVASGSAVAIYHRMFVVPRLQAFTALVDGSLDDPTRGLGALSETFGARTTRRLEELEATSRERDLRYGFVRYNSFSDVGSDLSFSLALLTDQGNGVVLTSIYSREETRTYGKGVESWTPTQGASEEEKRAIERARSGALATSGR